MIIDLTGGRDRLVRAETRWRRLRHRRHLLQVRRTHPACPRHLASLRGCRLDDSLLCRDQLSFRGRPRTRAGRGSSGQV